MRRSTSVVVMLGAALALSACNPDRNCEPNSDRRCAEEQARSGGGSHVVVIPNNGSAGSSATQRGGIGSTGRAFSSAGS